MQLINSNSKQTWKRSTNRSTHIVVYKTLHTMVQNIDKEDIWNSWNKYYPKLIDGFLEFLWLLSIKSPFWAYLKHHDCHCLLGHLKSKHQRTLQPISPAVRNKYLLIEFKMWSLTRLTWLIHTSVLPSIWNPGKIFAPIGQLGQAHMVKKIFLIFLHAGRWSFLLLNFWFSSKLVSKMN